VPVATGPYEGWIRAMPMVAAVTQHRAKEHFQKSRIAGGARSDFIRATDGAAISAGERCDGASGASVTGSCYECATRRFSHSQ
jgi:hypothetical protein